MRFATLFALLLLGCMTHQSSSERLMDAARDLNTAARFGRLDVAAEHASASSRSMFLERRQTWGNDIRVVDVNLTRMDVRDDDHAEIVVQYAWTRMDEGVLRNTGVRQFWTNLEKGGWQLEREQHAAGDYGLFGERAVDNFVHPPGDVHFQTKSLGSN
jgi:hypothetical protein